MKRFVEVEYWGEWVTGLVVAETITRVRVCYPKRVNGWNEAWFRKGSERIRFPFRWKHLVPTPMPTGPVPDHDHEYTGNCCTFPAGSLVHATGDLHD